MSYSHTKQSFPLKRKKNVKTLVLHTLTGKKISLLRRLAAKDFRRRPKYTRFWINCIPILSTNRIFSEKRLNGWLLVLGAKRIPHTLVPDRPSRVYIPPLYLSYAQSEISAFEKECPTNVQLVHAPHSYLVLAGLFCVLLYWHAVKEGWFPLPSFLLKKNAPSPAEWNAHFGLDAYRVVIRHEWWRCVTALFLHADLRHFFANTGAGVFFLVPLYRRLGSGLGLFLPIFAGVLGNIFTAFYHAPYVLSIGFSTALFGGMGVLVAFSAHDSFIAAKSSQPSNRKAYLEPLKRLAAGLAILGFWGSGGSDTLTTVDYPAHIFGLISGIAIGCIFIPLDKRIQTLPQNTQYALQAFSIAGTLSTVAFAWYYGTTHP